MAATLVAYGSPCPETIARGYRTRQSRLHRGLQSRPSQPFLDGLRQNARSVRTQEYRLRQRHAAIQYDQLDGTIDAQRLNVNEDEAARVRTIYELYLECGSIVTTLKEIERRDWRNKLSITNKGKERGGRYFDKSSLFKLLTKITYLGKIRYKE